MVKAISEIEQKYTDLILTETTVESCTEFLSYLESVIPEFFSRNGEAEGIHKMYDFMSESDNDLVVDCVDVRESAKIYSEYIEGMNKFIQEIKESGSNADASNMPEIEVKLETASTNDGIFISSIFGGAVNSKKETTIKEASDNIEYLIDFIPQIKGFKESVVDITEAVKLTPKYSQEQEKLLTESLEMLYKSISNYCKSNIINIFETYNDINESINNPASNVEEGFVLV